MTDFWTYFNSGLNHMLNLFAYAHILFVLALTVPYEFSSWKKLLVLISLFTIGHSLSLLLTVFNIVTVKTNIVDIIILITIFIIAFRNFISTGKSGKKNGFPFTEIITAFLGIIHGFGYSNYFNHFLKANPTDKLLPLFESAFGMFSGITIIVILALLLAYVVQTLFHFSKRDWTLIVSAFVIGVLIPVILQNEVWHK